MLVLVKLQGSGKPDDPFTAHFPTWVMIAMHEPSGRCLIDVPAEDVPAGATTSTLNFPWIPGAPVEAIRLIGGNSGRFTQHIRERYKHKFTNFDASSHSA